MAWYPYVFTIEDGDGHKQVIMTENGFTDRGDPELEEKYARYNKKLLEIAAKMPCVRTVHNFCLLCEGAMLQRAGIEQNQIGGLTEVYFGLFTEPINGCRPRKRAYAIQ